jgi:hypothetical protein
VLDDDALNSAIRIASFIKTLGKNVRVVRLQGKDPNVLGFENTLKQVNQTEMLDFSTLTRLRFGV